MKVHAPLATGHVIACPLVKHEEEVASTAYSWNNADRGDDHFVIIQRTVSGCGTFAWRGRLHPVPQGMAFLALVPEASCYGFRGGPAWKFGWLNLYGDLAVRMVRALRELHGPVVPLPLCSEAGARFHELAAGAGRRKDPYAVSAACYEFLCLWERELEVPTLPRDHAAWLRRALQERYREPLSIKALARDAGVSREHLVRAFARRYGSGPSTYLRTVRVARAKHLLAETPLPAKEIALRCGFPSTSALRRALLFWSEDKGVR